MSLDVIAGRCREISLHRTGLVGVYFLVEHEEIVYVGQSLDVETRIATHQTHGDKSFDRALYLEASEHDLDAYEGALIRALLPRYNEAAPADKGHDLRVLEALGLPASLAGGKLVKKKLATGNVGECIRACRVRAGLTQRELAARIGVSDAAVAMWETRVTEPRHARIAAIADALGVSVADLLAVHTSTVSAANSSVCVHAHTSDDESCMRAHAAETMGDA